MRKKICHLTSVHSINDGRIFHKECSSLSKAGFNVYLIAPNVEESFANNVHIIGVKCMKEGRLYRIFVFSKLIYKKALEVDADIYHFHDPELMPIGLKLIKAGKKVIYDVHEDIRKKMGVKPYIPTFIGYGLNILIGIYEDLCVKRLSAVVCATDFIAKRFYGLNSNVTVIKNYPILREMNENVKKESNCCVFTGILSRNLCIYEMVEAISLTKNVVKLYIAGAWNDEKYKMKVMTSAGWKYVEYLGYCSSEKVQKLMQKATIGIVIQKDNLVMRQAISTKLFEYMQNGLPVVSSYLPLHREINDEYHNQILVDPLNLGEIASAIDYLIDNVETAQEKGNNGKRAIYEKYNWVTEEQKLIDMYNLL